ENESGNLYAAGFRAGAGDSLIIYKFDLNGNQYWAKTYPYGIIPDRLIIDNQTGDFYLTTRDGPLGSYIIKFNSQGDTLWTYFTPVNVSFEGSPETSTASDPNYNIYFLGITGIFSVCDWVTIKIAQPSLISVPSFNT